MLHLPVLMQVVHGVGADTRQTAPHCTCAAAWAASMLLCFSNAASQWNTQLGVTERITQEWSWCSTRHERCTVLCPGSRASTLQGYVSLANRPHNASHTPCTALPTSSMGVCGHDKLSSA